MNKRSATKLASVMETEVERALASLGSPGHPRPFYLSFLVRDEETWEIAAAYGALTTDSRTRRRYGYCDVRVGSYRHDQVQDGGLNDNSVQDDSSAMVDLPFRGDRLGLQHGLWRLAEVRFREAVESLAAKRAYELTYVDRARRWPSFERREPEGAVCFEALPEVDEDHWRDFAERVSASIRRYPRIKDSSVRFKALHQVRVFVSSEGSRQIQSRPYWTLSCDLWLLSAKGDPHCYRLSHMVSDPRELPNRATFRSQIQAAIDRLDRLAGAPSLRSYAGPVLLDPVPAGLLVHEALGHRLEGNRLLSGGEGQTFRDSLGQAILPSFLSVRDDPRLTQWQGRSLVGHYRYDDEGVPAAETELVVGGVLRSFLRTRAGLSRRHVSNGHARAQRHERPISRMAVTLVEAEAGLSDEELKAALIREVERQKLPFGIRILTASGGETATESYDFQAFLGEIDLAARIYPDGREEWVRGVDFVGTPLNAVRTIVAAGKRYEVDNAWCGAESGWVPVSTISPALLVSQLELQAKVETPLSQPTYPMPWE